MAKQISVRALNLLKHTVQYDGKKEVDEKGNEKDSLRRLNGADSAQRRHFMKAIEEIFTPFNEKVQEVTNEFNEKFKPLKEALPRLENESDSEFDLRAGKLLEVDPKVIEMVNEVNAKINVLQDEEQNVELTDKTWKVVKKCFQEYGEECGFMVGDDKSVEEIESKL